MTCDHQMLVYWYRSNEYVLQIGSNGAKKEVRPMNNKLEVLKLLAELEACMVSIEETELAEIDRTHANTRRICRAGYKVLDDIYEQLGYK
jgi:hypothetical protein